MKLKPHWLSLSVSGCLVSILLSVSAVFATTESNLSEHPGIEMAKQAVKSDRHWNTTDHSKLELLQKNFTSGPEVTKACLTCHTEAGAQFQKTIHWTWMDPVTEKSIKLGKGGLSINNF